MSETDEFWAAIGTEVEVERKAGCKLKNCPITSYIPNMISDSFQAIMDESRRFAKRCESQYCKKCHKWAALIER